MNELRGHNTYQSLSRGTVGVPTLSSNMVQIPVTLPAKFFSNFPDGTCALLSIGICLMRYARCPAHFARHFRGAQLIGYVPCIAKEAPGSMSPSVLAPSQMHGPPRDWIRTLQNHLGKHMHSTRFSQRLTYFIRHYLNISAEFTTRILISLNSSGKPGAQRGLCVGQSRTLPP